MTDLTNKAAPACQGIMDGNKHCWHFPRGLWDVRYREGRDAEGPWTLTCCDCGAEADYHALNRRMAGAQHGPHRTGDALEKKQYRLRPAIRVLPRDGEPRA